MTAPALLITDYIHQIEKRDAQIAELRKRAETAERAWAAALDRARTAEEELAWLRKEMEQELDE